MSCWLSKPKRYVLLWLLSWKSHGGADAGELWTPVPPSRGTLREAHDGCRVCPVPVQGSVKRAQVHCWRRGAHKTPGTLPILWWPFYRWRNWGSQSLLPKVAPHLPFTKKTLTVKRKLKECTIQNRVNWLLRHMTCVCVCLCSSKSL